MNIKALQPKLGSLVYIGDITLEVLSELHNHYYLCRVVLGDNKQYFKGDTVQIHENTLVKNK